MQQNSSWTFYIADRGHFAFRAVDIATFSQTLPVKNERFQNFCSLHSQLGKMQAKIVQNKNLYFAVF